MFPSLCSNGVFSTLQTSSLAENDASGGSGVKRSVTNCPLYRCEIGRLTDAELQKLLVEMQKGDKVARLTQLPAGSALILEADVTSVLCEFPCTFFCIWVYWILFWFLVRISPSFLPLRPWKNGSTTPTTIDKPTLPSFELQSFLDQSISSEPHRGRINLLYVIFVGKGWFKQILV